MDFRVQTVKRLTSVFVYSTRSHWQGGVLNLHLVTRELNSPIDVFLGEDLRFIWSSCSRLLQPENHTNICSRFTFTQQPPSDALIVSFFYFLLHNKTFSSKELRRGGAESSSVFSSDLRSWLQAVIWGRTERRRLTGSIFTFKLFLLSSEPFYSNKRTNKVSLDKLKLNHM